MEKRGIYKIEFIKKDLRKTLIISLGIILVLVTIFFLDKKTGMLESLSKILIEKFIQ